MRLRRSRRGFLLAIVVAIALTGALWPWLGPDEAPIRGSHEPYRGGHSRPAHSVGMTRATPVAASAVPGDAAARRLMEARASRAAWGWGVIECDVDAELPHPVVSVQFATRPEGHDSWDRAEVVGTQVLLRAPPGPGAADVMVDGGLIHLTWDESVPGEWRSCTTHESVAFDAEVRIRVVESDGGPVRAEAETAVVGCGTQQLVRSGITAIRVPSDPCTLWVERWSGAAGVTGEGVEITPSPNVPTELTLVAPAAPEYVAIDWDMSPRRRTAVDWASQRVGRAP